MKNFKLPKNKSLSFKIIIGIAIIFLIVLLSWIIIFVINQKKLLTDQLNYRANTIAEASGIFCAPALLMEDYVVLQDYIEKIRGVDSNIVIAEISRNDEKVVAKYVSNTYSLINKSSLQFYVSSIKGKDSSGEPIGQFLIGLSTRDAERFIYSRIIQLVIVFILFFFISAVLIHLYLNYIVIKPIQVLDKFTKEISVGNLYHKIEIKNDDEFGNLSQAMDKMRNNIIEYYERIKKYNEELEEMVEIRTKDLSVTNERLEEAYQNLLDSQLKIIDLAFHDDLTGLSNRRSCKDKLDNILMRMNYLNQRASVIFVGLDNFKNINDKFGIPRGDQIIKETAKRLLDVAGNNTETARWRSDQFVVILHNIKNDGDAVIVAREISKSIGKVYTAEGIDIKITATIGISFFPEDDKESESLINKSIFALYEAKKEGKNRINLFDNHKFEKNLHNIAIMEELQNSISNEEFVLYYQPKVNKAGVITSLEALIRWKSRKYGFVSPDDFIPIAENSEIIIDIGNWVLKTACRDIVRFKNNGCDSVKIAINLSSKHFRHPELIEIIENTLKSTGCDAGHLEIEITETSAMTKLDESSKIIEKIHDLGISISIDDFGVGFSSLSRLSQLKFDSLKIDKSFVDDVVNDMKSYITVNSIIGLAHSLEKEVIAEGVETKEQFDLLSKLECDTFQGYLFGKPITSEEIEAILIGQRERKTLVS